MKQPETVATGGSNLTLMKISYSLFASVTVEKLYFPVLLFMRT